MWVWVVWGYAPQLKGVLAMMKNQEDVVWDNANVPVNIWLSSVDEDDEEYLNGFRFSLQAAIYCPRKDAVYQNNDVIYATTREELQDWLKEKVLPLYKFAVDRIESIINNKKDHLYYWG